MTMPSLFRPILVVLAALTLAPWGFASAADEHSPAERKQDAERHRAMAAAHQAAAQCLEAGQKSVEQCEKDLQQACKGLAIGKSCGMKHAH